MNLLLLGKETLELVKDLIPGILKFKVDNEFKDHLKKIEETSSISADFTPNDNIGYTVNFKIIEKNNIIFDLKVFAGSREQAQSLVDNWKANAENIYPAILEIINK